jgi:hypothetical protein
VSDVAKPHWLRLLKVAFGRLFRLKIIYEK